ncbi:heterogeneous nuclear ribonucleoprotein [Holotrichia oblita]|uniref:Heterogeneous nuclear ribonucleoprotein n=2 Tax=Holotrichia oblita TaxID=644536 RepID=A0ACB9TC98_HOLOL|nr:heterogeneous nuclear ribonucleoprotein [Holotrichia oblita]KAI4464483.1 heterogeneous nuclear ribonucleoprotein [Holotrichia oblita]
MQKHGPIEKFDLLFHRTGPLAGQPRGYAFVTFISKEDATRAKTNLNNLLVGSKNIVVTWAHSSATVEEVEKPKVELNIPALAMAKPERKTDREFQIQAIEAKLKLMEHNQNSELVINKTVATEVPIITQFQHNKQPAPSSNSRSRSSFKKSDRHHKPYMKHKTRR